MVSQAKRFWFNSKTALHTVSVAGVDLPPLAETRQTEIDPGTLAAFVPGEQLICPAELVGSGCQLEEAFDPLLHNAGKYSHKLKATIQEFTPRLHGKHCQYNCISR